MLATETQMMLVLAHEILFHALYQGCSLILVHDHHGQDDLWNGSSQSHPVKNHDLQRVEGGFHWLVVTMSTLQCLLQGPVSLIVQVCRDCWCIHPVHGWDWT
jgi:hypothetical protein